MSGGGFELKILDNYYLVGVVCQNKEKFYYSMAKRRSQWYIFKPNLYKISKDQVTDLAHGTQMLFYRKREEGEADTESESDSSQSSDSS
jgi:ubiquitin C-terminal hydrolase